MPQLDYTTFVSQLFWLALTFSILYIVLSKRSLPAIRDVLQARQDRVAYDLEKAEIAHTEAEEAKISYTLSLEKSRRHAATVLVDTIAAIKKESSLRHAELDRKLTSQTHEAEQRVSIMKKEVIAELQPVSQMLAELISAKIMATPFKADAIASVINQDN